MSKFGDFLMVVGLIILGIVFITLPVPGPIDEIAGTCMIGGQAYNLIKQD